MRKKEIPMVLRKIIESYLKNREICTGGRAYTIRGGCPQGSSLGPTLWLLIMEDLLEEAPDSQDYTWQAFANDIVVMVKAKSVKKIRNGMEKCMGKLRDLEKMKSITFE